MASAFFPSGLRVLAVDDDRAFLKILEKMLKKCSYEVTTFCLARDALNTLWERKDDFDIVITDVNMPDLDGFQLLEHVRIEMDLPIIMMSIDGGVDRVMKGIQHGACDYLLKPIRMEELQNIWQHVIRKKIRKGENIQVMTSGSDDDGHQQNAGETTATRKRKYMEEPESVDESKTIKKATRVVWSKELHYKFVEATTQLGFDKAKPKKILDLMNVPGLTRENVASHKQKYRSYLSKLRKENEVQTIEGMKQQDFSHPAGSFGFQTSTLMHPKDAANCDPEHRDNNMLPNGVDPQSSSTHTVGLGNQVAEKDKKATPSADTSQTILSHPFNYQTWNEIPMEHFRQPPNQDPEQYALLDDDFSHTLQSASENLIQVDPQCSAYTVGLGTSVAEKDKPNTVMITPLCLESRSGHGQTVNPEISDINVNYLNDCEPTQQNLFAVGDSFFGSLVGCASIETRGFQTSILMHPKDAANCNPEYRDNNMLLIVDPQCYAHTGCLETQVAEKDKADSVMITPLWSQSRSDHGQTVNPVISDAISSFKVSMQNQMVNVNSLNDCEPAQQNLFAVGDSLLGSIVGCASTETIGFLDVGLFDYSDSELLAEPEETYYCDNLGFEWDLLPELLAEPEEI